MAFCAIFRGISGAHEGFEQPRLADERRDAVDADLSGASSTAIDRDIAFTAAFDPLYPAMPGGGRMPPVEPKYDASAAA
jgi:hypothetical protein